MKFNSTVNMSERSLDEKFVCSNHFEDYAITNFINENGERECCNFCKPKHQSELAVSMDELLDFLSKGIYHFYDNADDAGLSYESSEGGHQGKHFDTYDLIYDKILFYADKPEITEEIIKRLGLFFWCKKDPFVLDEYEKLLFDWKRFSNLLKHQIRYTFFRTKKFNSEKHSEISDILRQIAFSIENLDLIKVLKKGGHIFRSRQHSNSESINSIEHLGSPPVENCSFSNRMSPAGISMFYGAFEVETAQREVKDPLSISEKPFITTGKFILKKDLQVVDLTKLPMIPSIFDCSKRNMHHRILFLQAFVNDISKSIRRDGFEHIEYVPTQVVTEYFKYIIPEIAYFEIEGIIYPSTKNSEGKACVLFVDNEGCKELFDMPKKHLLRSESALIK